MAKKRPVALKPEPFNPFAEHCRGVGDATLSRREWLELRRRTLGASDTPAIMGLSPWSTPLHIFLAKVGEVPDEPNSYQQWGTLFEEPIARLFAEEQGLAVERPLQPIYQSYAVPILSASLDRLVLIDGVFYPLEVKFVTLDEQGQWGEPGSDDIPQLYQIQCQQQLLVTGAPYCIVAAGMASKRRVQPYKVVPNERLFDRIVIAARAFWDLVETRTPPEVDWSHPKIAEAIDLLYGVDHFVTKEFGVGELELAKEYLAYQRIEAVAKKNKELVRAQILLRMGTAAVATVGDYKFTRTPVRKESYTVRATEYTQLRVTGPKDLNDGQGIDQLVRGESGPKAYLAAPGAGVEGLPGPTGEGAAPQPAAAEAGPSGDHALPGEPATAGLHAAIVPGGNHEGGGAEPGDERGAGPVLPGAPIQE